MKPFDLEAAKSGAPIVTRDGREARFIAHVPEFDEEYRVIVQISGKSVAVSFCENGALIMNEETPDDLFMKPQKRTVWVNIVKRHITATQVGSEINARVYLDEAKARNTAEFADKLVAVAVPIEIEE